METKLLQPSDFFWTVGAKIQPGITNDEALDIIWHALTEEDRLLMAITEETQADFDESVMDRVLSLLVPEWKQPVVDFADEIAALEAVQAELGTRFTISGGEVMELDGHLEARYEEQTDEYPF